MLTVFIVTVLLFASILVYFRIADRFNIIDKPNQRSSHTVVTIRGGGIIFPVAMLLFCFTNGIAQADYLWIALSMLMIALVSFWDDIQGLPNKVRILVHLASVSLLLFASHAFSILPLWVIPLAYVMIIGIINAYNFMDGINGITGVYTLAVLLSCLYLNQYQLKVMATDYILFPSLACLVFLVFNFRKKAKCFAGDVGSVSAGFWVISILLAITLATGNIKYIFFLSVYGVDAIFTIIHRLLLRQNIFEAHRLHFYQILVNERKMPHLLVASGYGVVQLLINIFILFSDMNPYLTGLLCCLPLVLVYVIAKPRLMKKQ